jgi:hypothetical protein
MRLTTSLLPLWEKVDRQREAVASRMRGLHLRIETPHPPSLREGTFSHKGRRKEAAPYSAWPSMIGPNSCHFSPVNFIIWTCSIG